MSGEERYKLPTGEFDYDVTDGDGVVLVSGSLLREKETTNSHYYNHRVTAGQSIKFIWSEGTTVKTTEVVETADGVEPDSYKGEIPYGIRKSPEATWEEAEIEGVDDVTIQWVLVELKKANLLPNSGSVTPNRDGSFELEIGGRAIGNCNRMRDSVFELELSIGSGPDQKVTVSVPKKLIESALN